MTLCSRASGEGGVRHRMSPEFCRRSDLATVASAAGFVGAVDDEYQRNCIEHPAGMTTARRPKVAESAIQVRAADEQGSRESCVRREPVCGGDQGEPAEEPVERSEVQEPRHEPSDRRAHPSVREKKRLT